MAELTKSVSVVKKLTWLGILKIPNGLFTMGSLVDDDQTHEL